MMLEGVVRHQDERPSAVTGMPVVISAGNQQKVEPGTCSVLGARGLHDALHIM